jgi:hypothetical protein
VLADAAPSPTDAWLVTLFFGGISPLLIWDARRFWRRGRHPVWDGRPGAWDPFGPAYWHGFCRCIPLSASLCSLGFTPVGVGMIIGFDRTLGLVVALLGMLAFCVIAVLMMGVFFFNRPRWCVPPHRRAEPGAAAEFAGEMRAKAQRRRTSRG